MSVTTPTEVLRFVREAEQRRRKARQAVDRELDAALSGAIAAGSAQTSYGRDTERRFHDERVRQAARLTELLEDRLQSFDLIIPNSKRAPVGSQILVPLLKAAPPKPAPGIEPQSAPMMPKPLTFWQSIIPGAKARQKTLVREAHDRFLEDAAEHRNVEQLRKLEWEAVCQHVRSNNNALLQFADELKAGQERALEVFYGLVLETTPFFPAHTPKAKVDYLRNSKHLLIDYELPEVSIVPDAVAFSYVRARRQIELKRAAPNEHKARYANVIFQLTLAALSVVFRSGLDDVVERVSLNGFVQPTYPVTGKAKRSCLVSVQTSRQKFDGLSLENASPTEVLKALEANFSSSPDELLPVKPMSELSAVNSGATQSDDMHSSWDSRPNLWIPVHLGTKNP